MCWVHVCGRSGSGPPILNGVLWVGQPTQVSMRVYINYSIIIMIDG